MTGWNHGRPHARRANGAFLCHLRLPGFAREIRVPGLTPKIPPDEIVMFARGLSMMTRAGLPVLECFRILTEQTDNQAFRAVVQDVARDVAEGMRLGIALGKHPKVFEAMFVSMVAAGETGGVLPELLQRLAVFIEKSTGVKKKLRAGMVYPAMITGVAAVTVGVLLVYVIPIFAEVYGEMGQALPTPTRLTIASSDWLRGHFHHLVLAAAGMAAAGRAAYRTPRGRVLADGWLLRAPIVGEVARKVNIVRFAHNMAALLGAGITALDGLSITAETLGNKSMQTAVLLTRNRLKEGETLARPLAASRAFPPMVCHMIAVGENTGALDKVLRDVAAFYEEEVDRAIAQLNALMEPVIMVVLGAVLGAIVVSIYLPIFQMGHLIQ